MPCARGDDARASGLAFPQGGLPAAAVWPALLPGGFPGAEMAQAGADIVSGSQAHQPQGMEFLNNSFIHYGLGNLFFDHFSFCDACRLGLSDRHVFYNGKYISTELLPIQFIDYARSRPMTLDEANALLQTLFSASGWQ